MGKALENAGTALTLTGGLRNRGLFKMRSGAALPLVSVITATYNAGADLERCILSVLGQQYRRIELIVVDGGSTDTTVDILKQYDGKIDCWISQKDRGVYDAFNKGVELANGEWLYFLGADDRFASDDVLVEIFRKPHISRLLYGNVRWGQSGKLYDGKFSSTRLFRKNICQQAIFYHRGLFEALGGFDLRYPLVADWVFNLRAFALPETRPFYLDCIVADYCTDGMSTEVTDELFFREREAIYLDCFGRSALYRARFAHGLALRILSAGQQFRACLR